MELSATRGVCVLPTHLSPRSVDLEVAFTTDDPGSWTLEETFVDRGRCVSLAEFPDIAIDSDLGFSCSFFTSWEFEELSFARDWSDLSLDFQENDAME